LAILQERQHAASWRVDAGPSTLRQPRRVLGRQYGDHAGHRRCRGGVDRCDRAAADRALHDDAVGQLLDRPLRAVACGSGHLEAAIQPVDRVADHAVAPTRVSARISVRFASSILNALWARGTAPATAASAAARYA